MKILALDQSSQTSGFAIFDNGQLVDSGTFTLLDSNIGKRLVKYKQKIAELIEKYDIEEVAFEDIQMQGGNVHTFKILAEIYGVTEEYLTEQKHSYQVIGASSWRSSLNIKGRARAEQKKNAQTYVLEHYNKKVSTDEADAICIGACASKKYEVFDWS